MVLRQKMVYGYAMAHRYDKDNAKYSLLQKAQVLVLRTLGNFMRLCRILEKQDKISTAYRNDETGYYCITNFPVRSLSLRYDAADFDGVVRLKLGKGEFSCPCGYDKILTKYYGDYMTPPKKEDRVSLHIGEEK